MRCSAIIIGIALALQVLPIHHVDACSCRTPGTVQEEVEQRNAVFEGRVIRVTRGLLGYYALFKVERSWKGVTSKYVTVETGLGGGDCGVRFKVSDNNVTFFSGSGDGHEGLTANSCAPHYSAADVVAFYGPGTTNLTNNWWLTLVPPFWPVIVFGILVAGIVLLILIRKKQATAKPA